MKKVLIICGLLAATSSFGQKSFEISAAYNYVTEAENLYFWEADRFLYVGSGSLFKAEGVNYFSSFGVGGYFNVGTIWYDGFEDIGLVEAGSVFKYKIEAGKINLIPTIYLGYRTYGDENAGDGFGANFSLITQYNLDQIKPFLDLGFISQPVGGNDATGISFGPVFSIGAGIAKVF